MSTPGATSDDLRPSRLTVFAFLWACQALEHQEFYSSWIRVNSVTGWTLTILAAATVLRPRSLVLFTGMLVASVVYNIGKWPFVVNHILVESVVNATILAAIATTWALRRRGITHFSAREEIFDRFAPVVRAMFVVVYYWAFIAKLNTGFLNPDVSCAVVMYGDLTDRVPFVPNAPYTRMPAIWVTLAVEAAIPVLLTFRRTRPLAIALGLPFHFVLGLVGHRTFSGLAYALYALFCMEALVRWLAATREAIRRRLGSARRERYRRLVRIGAVLLLAFIAVELKLGSVLGIRLAPAVWIVGSLVIALVYLRAIVVNLGRHADPPRPRGRARPGLLWVTLALVVLNGSTQYLGLKTQTNFTMYSNLRTEGGSNNHLFMPVFRLFDYQDDLVDVLETDYPRLRKYMDDGYRITHFEFRRLVSEAVEDFQVTYLRDDRTRRFELRQGVGNDPALRARHPLWLAKLLYFRPVDSAENPRCQH